MIDSVRRTILVSALFALGIGTVLAAWRISTDPLSVPVANAGIIGPFAAMCGVSVGLATLASWASVWTFAALAAVAHRATQTSVSTVVERSSSSAAGDEDHGAIWLGAVSLVVALGVALRMHAAAWAPWDVDEPWAFPSSGTLFDDSHDALVHPPFFRALTLGWTQAIGWTLQTPRWLLRTPSLMFGCLSIALIARLALSRREPPAWIALLLAAVSSTAIAVSALARPYAFATLAVVLVVTVIFDAGERRLTPLEAAACVVAVGVAAWCDLLAGAIAVTALTARAWVDVRARRPRTATLLAAGALIPALPLVPGALRAWRTGIDPATSTITGPIPDLRAAPDTADALRELLAATSAPLPTVLAAALLIALLVLAWRRRARVAATLVICACTVAITAPLLIAVRARHLAWLPLLCCALLAILPPTLPKRAP